MEKKYSSRIFGGGGTKWKKLIDKEIVVDQVVSRIEENLLETCEGMSNFFISLSTEPNLNPDVKTQNDNFSLEIGKGNIGYGRLCDPTNKVNVLAYINVIDSISVFSRINTSLGLEYNVAPVQMGMSPIPRKINYNELIIFPFTAGYKGKISIKIYGRD